MKNKRILIIGAGLSGAATAYFLKRKGIKASIFEREKECGGLCRSIKKGGFTFDFSGHLLHFRNPEVLSLVKKILKGNLTKHKRQSFIYTFNRFILSPYQVNFYNLPQTAAAECLKGLRLANNNGRFKSNNSNFLEWIKGNFGEGIAKHFMVPYNLKFWKTPLDKLSSEWADRFIVRRSFKSIKDDFSHHTPQILGYNAYFWYPKKGGIEKLIEGFSFGLNVNLRHEVEEIDLKEKQVRFKTGRKEKFDILITTLALPELIKVIKGLPKTITTSLKKLSWISIYNINLGVEGRLHPGRHWIYFPQNKLKFFRTGFYHNFSDSLTPPDKSSLYIEISYANSNHLDKSKLESRILKDLKKCGIIDKDNKVKVKCINDIKYAYPVYDHNWREARDKVLKYLNSQNILSVGRFGSWRYLSMEDVILEAKDTAEAIYRNEI